MSEEITQNTPDSGSFEERVFARLDSIDARLQSLENQAERRALETKLIWERALAGILEIKEGLGALEQLSNQTVRKIDVLDRAMLILRADQTGVENRLDKLESLRVHSSQLAAKELPNFAFQTSQLAAEKIDLNPLIIHSR